ncbi:MAG: hypothetical protein JSS73_14540 [Bacteroidetes bacterium]|nr:hypothetical protein [Bacteroidota bacterium]
MVIFTFDPLRHFNSVLMVSLDQCRQILEKSGRSYSDEQIVKMREFLYKMASIDYQLFKLAKPYDKDSNNLHPGLDR